MNRASEKLKAVTQPNSWQGPAATSHHWNYFDSGCCFWCHVPSWPGTVATLWTSQSRQVRSGLLLYGLGWGGVGIMTFFELEHMVDATQLCLSCHCTHGGCYATVFVLSLHTWWMLSNSVCLELARGVGWGGVNLNTWWMLRNSVCLVTAHMAGATQLCLSCHCTHGGCYATLFVLNLHVGWGGVGWTWTHGGCYATLFVLSLHTWWMLRNCVCLVIAHMVDAKQLCLPWTCTWGGVGWGELEHMVDATQLCLSCHCTHGGRYATVFVLSLHTWWMLRNSVCLELAHGVGWGGVGMMTFFELEHMVDATQLCLSCHCTLWETTWRSKTTFCVVVHISRTSFKNRKTSDCVVNHMILDYANVWHHRASRRRVTLFLEYIAACHCMQLWWSTSQHIYATGTRTHSIYVH